MASDQDRITHSLRQTLLRGLSCVVCAICWRARIPGLAWGTGCL